MLSALPDDQQVDFRWLTYRMSIKPIRLQASSSNFAANEASYADQ